MSTVRSPRYLRITDLQQLIRHIFLGSRRPSFVKYRRKPISILFVHLVSSTSHNVDFICSSIGSEPILFGESLPIKIVLNGLNLNLEIKKVDLQIINPTSINKIEKQDIYQLFGYSLAVNSAPSKSESHQTESKLESNQFESHDAQLDKLFATFKRPYKFSAHFLVALDCEMVRTSEGFALGRVTLLNHDGSLLYDRYIKPNLDVVDFLSEYSGLTHDLLKDGISFESAQRDILEFIGTESIVLGHGLEHDLNILQIFTEHLIDTSYLYQSMDGYKIKLSQLSKNKLNENIQKNTHNSEEDALCCLKLLALRIHQLEQLESGSGKRIEFGTSITWLDEITEIRGRRGIGLVTLDNLNNKLEFQDLCDDKSILICVIYELEGKKFIVMQQEK